MDHFGVGAPPILVFFSGDWDVHWGYDLAFDPWPHMVDKTTPHVICQTLENLGAIPKGRALGGTTGSFGT